MTRIPISESITIRPVWARRQRRHYFQGALSTPTAEEVHDAILVLSDPRNQLYAPALHLEAFRILDEGS